jgi:hypothetical protein
MEQNFVSAYSDITYILAYNVHLKTVPSIMFTGFNVKLSMWAREERYNEVSLYNANNCWWYTTFWILTVHNCDEGNICNTIFSTQEI